MNPAYNIVRMAEQQDSDSDLSREILICGLWHHQTDATIDVQDTDSDAKPYHNMNIKKHLKAQEKEEKNLHVCQESWKNFTPFMVAVGRVFRCKAQLLMKQLACALSKKWTYYVSYALNYVKTMLSIAVVRVTYWCLRGSRDPSRYTNPDFLPFEDGAGLALVN
eukprot:15350774-Ditylum_brightwellii.AAC.1